MSVTPLPETVAHAFADAWNAHDMNQLADLFAPDGHFVNVIGLWWRSSREIREAHAVTHASLFRDSRLDVLQTDTRQATADVALVRMLWQLSGHVSPMGETLPPRTGLLLFVLRRHDDGWTIVDAQNTDIVEGVLSRPQ